MTNGTIAGEVWLQRRSPQLAHRFTCRDAAIYLELGALLTRRRRLTRYDYDGVTSDGATVFRRGA